MYPVRNSVKALIVRDGRLLCIRKKDKVGSYFILPGGGQEKDETFVETLARECREEIGAEVEVKDLKHVREYIGKNHEFRDTDDAHQVEYMFEVVLKTEPDLAKASHLDTDQDGLEWIRIEKGGEARVYPKVLLERLADGHAAIYWGDVN